MAEKIPVRHQHTGDRELDELQRLAQEIARRLNLMPFASGVLVTGVKFTTGIAGTPIDVLINHGLGRKPRGAFKVRDYGTGLCTGVGEATTQPTDMTKQIKLRLGAAASSSCVVDLWIF